MRTSREILLDMPDDMRKRAEEALSYLDNICDAYDSYKKPPTAIVGLDSYSHCDDVLYLCESDSNVTIESEDGCAIESDSELAEIKEN
ncbi:hypothetical protein M0L28_RS15575, partial [Proteus mirabilis]|nr:hypothetical protein [Proteus mirabilis]